MSTVAAPNPVTVCKNPAAAELSPTARKTIFHSS